MNEPKRLIEDGTDFDRALLRAGREDRPSNDYERRVIAAAALAPAAVAVAQPTLLARILRPKYLAILAIGAGAATVASLSMEPRGQVTGPERASTGASAVQAPPAADEPAANHDPVEVREAAPVTTPDALPSVPAPATPNVATVAAAPRATVATVAPSAPAAPSAVPTTKTPASEVAPAKASAPATGATLQREVELLDAVKRSLRSGENASAERALDAYDREFPSGTLAPEAGFLRIRLLLAKGERARAAALGDELLARHPNSVHAKRIRAALAADAADVDRAAPPQASPR